MTLATAVRALEEISEAHGIHYSGKFPRDVAWTALDKIEKALAAAATSRPEFTHIEAWRELVNKDDRTSPEEYPEMCLINYGELQDYIARAVDAALAAAPAREAFLIEELRKLAIKPCRISHSGVALVTAGWSEPGKSCVICMGKWTDSSPELHASTCPLAAAPQAQEGDGK